MKSTLLVRFLVVIIAAAMLFSACSSDIGKMQYKLTVAVSIVPQETFVKAIAGDIVDVVTSIPPGKSPSNYAPAPQELERLSHASAYFTAGVPAEQGSVLPKLKEINGTIKIIELPDIVKEQYPEREFSPGQRDPHIWLSPKRAVVMVESIAHELSSLDSKNSDLYQKNASDYIDKLKILDKEIEKMFENHKNSAFIIYHPSLGYFADDYGLTMIPIQSEGKDTTPDDLKRVIDEAKSYGIKTVFYQAEIDSRHSEVIAGELDGKAVEIAPLAPDYIENLKKIAASIISSD